MRKVVSGIILALLAVNMLSIAFNIQPAKAEWTGTVYIRADGSIDPPDAPIITYDNITYFLTDDITSSGDGVVIERDNVTLDGTGHAIKGIGSGRPGINIGGRENIIIKDVTIKGFSPCISVIGSKNCIIKGNDLTTNGTGIQLGWSYTSTHNNTIYGNTIRSGGEYVNPNCIGINVADAHANIVKANKIVNMTYGIRIAASSYNNISDNTFINCGIFLAWEFSWYMNHIKNNTVNGKPLVYLYGVNNYEVADAGQVILVNCSNITVKNLDLPNYSTVGIELVKTQNSTIANNNIANQRVGIYLCHSPNNTVSENKIENCISAGIEVWHGKSYYSSLQPSRSNNFINRNRVINCSSGISLEYSTDNIIDGNSILNCVSGIGTFHSHRTVITNNDVKANYIGIGIGGSSFNNVTGNNIRDNFYGMDIGDCYGSSIFHNNFINNTIQVYMPWGGTHVWDGGYPSGGNYWSDYTGIDEKSGPNQDQPGSDGIGDTPYIIDENNVDHYPLMSPWTPTPPIQIWFFDSDFQYSLDDDYGTVEGTGHLRGKAALSAGSLSVEGQITLNGPLPSAVPEVYLIATDGPDEELAKQAVDLSQFSYWQTAANTYNFSGHIPNVIQPINNGHYEVEALITYNGQQYEFFINTISRMNNHYLPLTTQPKLREAVQNEAKSVRSVWIDEQEYYIVTLKAYIDPTSWEPYEHSFLAEEPPAWVVYTYPDFEPISNETLMRKIWTVDRANNLLKRVGTPESISNTINTIDEVITASKGLSEAEYTAVLARTTAFMTLDLVFFAELGLPIADYGIGSVLVSQLDYYTDPERFTLESGRALLNASKMNYQEAKKIAELNRDGISDYATARDYINSYYRGYFEFVYGVEMALPAEEVSKPVWWEVVSWLPEYIKHLALKFSSIASKLPELGTLLDASSKVSKNVLSTREQLRNYINSLKEIEEKMNELFEAEAYPIHYTLALVNQDKRSLYERWGIHGVDYLNSNLCSPAELRIYDSQGRATGVISGEVIVEIPNSFYFYSSESVTIFFPEDSYVHEVAGTGEGTYRLELTFVALGQIFNFTATDIPTNSGSIHQFTVDWDALSLGEKGVTVQVDNDGDGVFEHTFTSDSELNHKEYVIATDDIPPRTWLDIREPKFVVNNVTYLTSATPIALIAEDNPGGSVVALTAYRIYNASYDSGWITYTQPFYLTGLSDGTYQIDYNSTDYAGNVEPTKTATIILDNTPPKTTLTIGEPKYLSDTIYVTPDTSFILEANDVGSGVYSTVYRIYNSTYDSGWIPYMAPFNLTALTDGVYTIEFYSTDTLGNIEATSSIQVTLFSWDYIFEDSYGRETVLKINLAHKFFQFITHDEDYGIRQANYMQKCRTTIVILHCDGEITLTAVAIPKIDFCIAIALDKQTHTKYFLLDRMGLET